MAERVIRFLPAAAVKELQVHAFDGKGRETFAFLLDCEHGAQTALVVSETRTVRQVADQLATAAIENCAGCKAISHG